MPENSKFCGICGICLEGFSEKSMKKRIQKKKYFKKVVGAGIGIAVVLLTILTVKGIVPKTSNVNMAVDSSKNSKKEMSDNTLRVEDGLENEGLGSDNIEIIAAGEFNNGLASILFSYEDSLYKGFVDKEGKFKFYSEWNFESDYDRQFWRVLDWDYNNMNVGFDNGYSWFEYQDNRYIIDEEGNILSSYPVENVICTGAGYTWIQKMGETSWNDEGKCKFTLYTPYGQEETSIALAPSEMEDGHSYTYLGEGVFTDKWNEYFYFTKSGKWLHITDDIVDWMGRYSDFIFECKYTALGMSEQDNKEYPLYIALADSNGEVYHIDIPKEYDEYFDQRLKGLSNGFILLAQSLLSDTDDYYLLYNMKKDLFTKYTGIYADYVYSHMGYMTADINQDCFAFKMIGEDGNKYVGLIANDSMTEVGEPVYIDGEFALTEDVLAVWNETSTCIYDMHLNLLSTFNSDVLIDCIHDGVMLSVSEDNKWNYLNYDGTVLFDNYDFSYAVDLLKNIN